MNVVIDQYKRLSAGSRHVLIREKDNKVIAKGNNKMANAMLIYGVILNYLVLGMYIKQEILAIHIQ